MASKVALILGVGPGIGGAVAKKWASMGFSVACVCRGIEKAEKIAAECGSTSRAYSGDVTDVKGMAELVKKVESEMGPISFLCYNSGRGFWKNWTDITESEFSESIAVNATGLLTAAKLVCPGMVERGEGSVAITGATASLRGKPFTTGFAAAKGAQRMLAQSLARDLGPKGVHVYLVIIDGGVGVPSGPDDKLDPDAIAQAYWGVSAQPKNAWSFELDLRPSTENW